MAAIYEVMVITPFFAEVAIIPNYGTVIVTTTASINDDYQWRIWDDGIHHSNSIHIALGSNTQGRDTIVHAAAHADFDILDPVIKLDGKIIYQKGIFDDAYIEKSIR